MKSKLVKYPFSEKKYRWDTWEQGKEFEYYWDESLPNNFETIEPYIGYEDLPRNVENNWYNYGIINLINDDVNSRFTDTTSAIDNIEKAIIYQRPGHNITESPDRHRSMSFRLDKKCHQTITSPTIFTTSGFLPRGISSDDSPWLSIYGDTRYWPVENTFIVKPSDVFYVLEQDANDPTLYWVDMAGSRETIPNYQTKNVKKLDYEALVLASGYAEKVSFNLSNQRSYQGIQPNFMNRDGVVYNDNIQ